MAKIIVTSKCCSKCKEVKPVEAFVKNKDARDGRRAWCRKCCSDYAKSYASNPPSKRQRLSREEYKEKDKVWKRHTKLKYFYGLTLEQYQIMLDAQNGVCTICGKPETWVNNYGKVCPLSVEHDHVTGRVRALVCNRCNRRIAIIENSPEYLAYLKKHGSAAIVDLFA